MGEAVAQLRAAASAATEAYDVSRHPSSVRTRFLANKVGFKP